MSKLRKWRQAKKITQKAAADMFKMSVSYLSMIETGARTPSLSKSLKIQTVTKGLITPNDYGLRKVPSQDHK